jgi:hypothetical protein
MDMMLSDRVCYTPSPTHGTPCNPLLYPSKSQLTYIVGPHASSVLSLFKFVNFFLATTKPIPIHAFFFRADADVRMLM